jgi:hypothetical protein
VPESKLELTVKREKIQIMPESSKRTVAVTYLTGIGAVILAAGGSTRIGIPKQLLQLRGQTFLGAPRPSHLRRDAGR